MIVMLIKKGGEGFTIIELMVSIGLFGIIAPSIVLSVVAINQLNDRAADLGPFRDLFFWRKKKSKHANDYQMVGRWNFFDRRYSFDYHGGRSAEASCNR